MNVSIKGENKIFNTMDSASIIVKLMKKLNMNINVQLLLFSVPTPAETLTHTYQQLKIYINKFTIYRL